MIKLLREIKFHFVLAFVIRLVFTFYGLYHDAYVNQANPTANSTRGQQHTNVMPKYTDIDYQVFSDAASYVYQGESPYLRETYRYTPLLAYLLQTNEIIHEASGKFLFVTFDLICGWFILKINELDDNKSKSKPPWTNLAALAFWFYNPITVAIASRGNAESLMAFLVLAFVYFFKRRSFIAAGLFYGLAVHFKIYPITYALLVLLYLVDMTPSLRPLCCVKSFLQDVLFNVALLKFGLASLFTLSLLTYYFYLKYGYEFLYETYLYHLSRQDTRHNFSPYFYMLYLTETDSVVLKAFTFLPQFVLVVTFSIYFRKHVEFALFSITFMFVTFNKVCTSQYFVWYLSLIPLLVPRLKISLIKALAYFLLWMFGQAVWLYFAYELEFNGKNTFVQIWLSSLLFASINCYIFKFAFIDNYNFDNQDDLNKKSN